MDADARTRARTGRWTRGAAAGLLLVLGGCTAARVQGTAVRGEIGKAILVTHTDPRLAEGGVGGVKVEVTTAVSGRGGQTVLATTTTDENGAFSVPIRGQVPPRMTIRATKEGEYDVRSTVARPGSGERVLILMRPPRTP
ncbi:MAG: hypothetical protein R3B57_07605 [Phycisphaerales bacterium]